MKQPNGVFVGLSTLDIIYKVEELPRVDEKINALEQFIAAGGPATNAAVTFAFMGGNATLVAAVGRHSMGRLVRDELKSRHVRLIDFLPDNNQPPPFSSVLIKEATGERSVVSINARNTQADSFTAPGLLGETDIVMVDGHQMAAAIDACALARKHGLPCVMDAGSWKPDTERLLSFVDFVICSARFFPPGCTSHQDVVKFLQDTGVKHVAISRGAQPIIVADDNVQREIELERPSRVVDTVAAGDVLHGAFCYYLLSSHRDFVHSVVQASRVASFSCGFFGTREWMDKWRQ